MKSFPVLLVVCSIFWNSHQVVAAQDTPPAGPKPVLPLGYVAKPGTEYHASGYPLVMVCEKDGAEMVFVPAGTFISGINKDRKIRPTKLEVEAAVMSAEIKRSVALAVLLLRSKDKPDNGARQRDVKPSETETVSPDRAAGTNGGGRTESLPVWGRLLREDPAVREDTALRIATLLDDGQSPPQELWEQLAAELKEVDDLLANGARKLRDGLPWNEFPVSEFLRKGICPATERRCGAFYIDRYEVTNARFKRFVEDTGYEQPTLMVPASGRLTMRRKQWHPWTVKGFREPNKPVVCIGYDDALAYTRWAGKSLPTEDEWEYAARGRDRRLYPWGDERPRDESGKRRCRLGKLVPVIGRNRPANVGSYKEDVSPFGVYDMGGNVSEWTIPMRPIEDRALVVGGDGENRFGRSLFERSDGSGGIAKGASHMDPPFVEWTILALRSHDIGVDIAPKGVGFRTVLRLPNGDSSAETDERTKEEE